MAAADPACAGRTAGCAGRPSGPPADPRLRGEDNAVYGLAVKKGG
ncbi:hypothetical protein KCH_77070 [Kitasatospora cheerisanensis KCTC 2395]|uniref:Uncharacterized protein n=1 Tax=Kitasatospora cheerisanensis KCTC 2395 TaxID=1348663 RepID=A0A066YRJ5_9ACTN|nr:hypothetical protein KCH_77070 [Kitasatospora cheerisanensis KCTC 2395]